jgi:hypothetical protein
MSSASILSTDFGFLVDCPLTEMSKLLLVERFVEMDISPSGCRTLIPPELE